MEYKKFKKQSLPEEIVGEILKMIQNGELRPGDKLPTERYLMEQMDVSRSSIREALRALSVMNVIDIRQGQGTFVTSLNPDLLMEHMEFVVSLVDATVLNSLEARKMIEVYCAGLAAERVTSEDIEELDKILNQSSQSSNDRESFRKADINLHRMIVDIVKNPIITRIYRSIERLNVVSRDRTGSLPGVREKAREDHREIIEAIIDKDSQKARAAMLSHLDFIEKNLIQDLERTKTQDS